MRAARNEHKREQESLSAAGATTLSQRTGTQHRVPSAPVLGHSDQDKSVHLAALGSAPIQHAARKRREITGINRTIETGERPARLVGLEVRFARDWVEKPQLSGLI